MKPSNVKSGVTNYRPMLKHFTLLHSECYIKNGLLEKIQAILFLVHLKFEADNFEYSYQTADILPHLVTSKLLAVALSLPTTPRTTINNNNNVKHLYSRQCSKCFTCTNLFNPSSNTVT